MSDKKVRISVKNDGPLEVSGFVKLRGPEGEEIETGETVYLCRCGGSSNKPFCDGTHAVQNYSGKRLSERPLDKERDYDGAGITIHDNRGICSHAALCVAKLGGVFSQESKPWITPDGASVAEIVEFVQECPSGALN